MRKVMVVGATSTIAHETAKHFAAEGARLFLIGRNAEKLQVVADDLQVRGADRIDTFLLDMNEFERHEEVLQQATEAMDGLDVLFVAHGTLPDQERCEQSVDETLKEFSTNCLSVISLLTLAANYFEVRGHGTIAVITSVAGDRGRQNNYVYGSAKGALNLFLQGLRSRLFRSGVNVVTIKPGPVDTPMTAQMQKGALFTAVDKVGEGIYRAIITGRDEVYIPSYWLLIMTLLRLVPEAIFKRMNLAA